MGGGDLTDIGWRHHTGRANGQAPEDPIGNELPGRSGDAGPPRTDQEEKRRHHQNGPAPENIRQPPSQKRPDGAAKQHGRHAEPRADGIRSKGGLQPLDRAIDHAAVITEQKAAQSGHKGDENSKAEAAPCLIWCLCHLVPPAPLSSTVRTVVLSSVELLPTMISNSPGSTTRSISRL